jgi:hypothetical protein
MVWNVDLHDSIAPELATSVSVTLKEEHQEKPCGLLSEVL